MLLSITFEREVTNCVLASSLGDEEETMPIPQVQESAATLLVQGEM